MLIYSLTFDGLHPPPLLSHKNPVETNWLAPRGAFGHDPSLNFGSAAPNKSGARLSERQGAPVLICPVRRPTTRSAMKESWRGLSLSLGPGGSGWKVSCFESPIVFQRLVCNTRVSFFFESPESPHRFHGFKHLELCGCPSDRA